MGTPLKLARLANLVLAGMLTGNEFGSRVTVHPALGELPSGERVRAEQAVTRRYGRIMPALMVSTLASFLPVTALETPRFSPAARLHLAGLGCYGAMLAVTLSQNVPINGRLLELDAETDGEEFAELRARWDRLHSARNALNVSGLVLTALGALSSPAR